MGNCQPADAEPRLLMNSDEVCAHLGISPRKLAYMKTAGEIPYVQLGRSIRYRAADIERLIEQHLQRRPDARDHY